MESIYDLWQQALEIIQQKVETTSYDMWFKATKVISLENDTLIIEVLNDFHKDRLLGKTYFPVIRQAIFDLMGEELEIKFALPNEFVKESSAEQTVAVTEENYLQKAPQHMLNPKYTFDMFVIGSGNRFAHAASLAVAETPADAYNPLFLYGGVGLGKTHLMHAIGHYILQHNPNAKVAYVSSEKFVNDFINALQSNQAESFRNKYRSIDVLLIDDIQFIAGKEATQEEFFHTFNTLHNENKQIIISSDRPPKEIPTLEDRLRSRFEWGLITDITPPDLETRIAILRKKAKADGLEEIPNEVMLYIANQIDSNIRELEGALTRVVAQSTIEKQDITPDLAARALKSLIPSSKSTVLTIKDIQQAVAKVFHMKIDDFKSKKRTQSIAFPRQVAMYLSRELTDFALLKIGEEFGGRDHTTVIHAHEKISKLLLTDEGLQSQVKKIKDILNR